ncbi:lysosomal alpha-mannosidase-like [Amblyomma americanum]
MPYTDGPGRTWTGFYTTKPNLKMMVRYANGFLQASKQLSVLGKETTSSQVRQLSEAVATLLHHDGITGTSTTWVARDYANILYQGIAKCEAVISASLVSLLDPDAPRGDEAAKLMRFCHLLNQSDCLHTSAENQFGVIVYNPASVQASPYVRLPLVTDEESVVTVIGPGGAKVEWQAVPLAPHRHGIPESLGLAKSSLVFQANVEPLGASLYYVKSTQGESSKSADFLEIHEEVNFIENEKYRVELDADTGLVSRIVLRQTQTPVELHQSFAAYGFNRYPEGNMSPPGHYVFSAYTPAREMGEQVTYRVVKGPLVQEVHQIFNEYISQVITLHKNSPFIEFTWTVGALDKLLLSSGWSSSSGCDIVSRFESNLDTDEFYTDSNGWRTMRRTVRKRKNMLPIPSNYYPVTSWIYIKDRSKGLQMLILPDRPQGGSSIKAGQLEIMVHRRHETNDNLGLPDPLLEMGVDDGGLVARGTHRLFLGSPMEARGLMRLQALQLVYQPLPVFTLANWKPKLDKFSVLRSPLPGTVHVLTLERLPGTSNQVLLRLEHLALKRTAVMINITRLLKCCRLENVQPVTLAANQFLPQATRQQWPTRHNQLPLRTSRIRMTTPEMRAEPATGDVLVKLIPRQIATFLANLVVD